MTAVSARDIVRSGTCTGPDHRCVPVALAILTMWAGWARGILSLPRELGPGLSRKELTSHEQPCFAWLSPPAPPLGRTGGPGAAGPVHHPGLSGAVGRPDATSTVARVDVLDPAGRRHAQVLDLAGIPGAAGRDRHQGHPLRNALVQARHRVASRIGGHAAGSGRARCLICAGVLRRRLYDE